jgi:hypothetical protein
MSAEPTGGEVVSVTRFDVLIQTTGIRSKIPQVRHGTGDLHLALTPK